MCDPNIYKIHSLQTYVSFIAVDICSSISISSSVSRGAKGWSIVPSGYLDWITQCCNCCNCCIFPTSSSPFRRSVQNPYGRFIINIIRSLWRIYLFWLFQTNHDESLFIGHITIMNKLLNFRVWCQLLWINYALNVTTQANHIYWGWEIPDLDPLAESLDYCHHHL